MENNIWQEMGLTDSEYEEICRVLDREPNFTELGMYSVMWSEHCSYKHSKKTLRLFPVDGEHVLQGPGENAGVVSIGDGLAVVFKVESHNHPSAIEPYQGAATGVGGILRDIFTMGARPIALLNSLRFGPLDSRKTRYLFDGVVEGIGGYGNCVGIPTVAGEVYFEDCYRGNPLVNAMAVGVLPEDKLSLSSASGVDNLVVLVGARTGRDGIHGVTFASEELGEDSEEKRPSVQVGDPFMEKLLIEACMEVVHKNLVVGMQDLGGAGLTCAVTETASGGGTGMEIELNKVPCREKDMRPDEIMLSESQERMLFIVENDKIDEVRDIFSRWELPFSVIGKVTADGLVNVYHDGKLVASVPAQSVADGAPEYDPDCREPDYIKSIKQADAGDVSMPPDADCDSSLLEVLSSPTIADKEWVWRRYDHMVRISTVVKPGAADAAVLRLRDSQKGLAVTLDGNGRHVYLDPYRGGIMAVAEAARNISCTGGKPLGITDCLNFGNPEKPEIFWQFKEAVAGMVDACHVLQLPVVGGNVSFYNEVEETAIYPTPVIGAVGVLDDVRAHTTMSFQNEGDVVVMLGSGNLSLGGSEYQKVVHGQVFGSIAEVDLKMERALQELLQELIASNMLTSAHDISDGGMAVTIAECCMGGKLGAEVGVTGWEESAELMLFGEGAGRVIVSMPPEITTQVQEIARSKDVSFTHMGEVKGGRLKMHVDGEVKIDLSLSQIESSWREAIPWKMKS